MNHSILITALLSVLSLTACEKTPTVINVPDTPVTVPGPVGPQGATGYQGEAGQQGKAGMPGETTTVIITPPPAPAN